MRYPDGHKESVRARIVTEAARALRAQGIAGVSIPTLMERVGLTHGGFYRHFEGRAELVAEAVRAAFAETEPRIFGAAAKDGDALDAVLESYLEPAHRQHPDQGCVMAALGSEAPRQEAPVRRAFAEVSGRFLRDLEAVLYGPGSVASARPRARELHDDTLAIAAAMVGAVMISRVLDDALGERVLAATRRFIRRAHTGA